MPDTRVPVVLFDRLGYSWYHDPTGRPFLPADEYEVRLVTDVTKLDQAKGAEVRSVVGVERADLAGFAEAVRFQHGLGGRPAHRLIAITERILLTAARLREELGIPGATVADTLPFRDKVVMKEHLRGHGVRVPEFAPASRSAGEDLLRAHGRIVAKPRLGAGSVDIRVIDDLAGLDRFRAEEADRLDEFELEQFVDGTMYHIDSVVHNGRVVAATAGHSIDPTTAYRDGRPYRDVALPPGELRDAVLAFNADVIACHPTYSGATHHEVFVSGGDVWFCEIAARAGGGGVIPGFLSRTGVSLDEACVLAQASGTVPSPLTVAEHLTGYAMVYAGPGRVTGAPPPPDEPWVLDAQLRVAPGEVLGAPASWDDAVAILSVRGDTVAEVRDRIERVVTHTTPVVG